MSSSAQSVVSSVSDGMSAAGHSVADALEVVSAMISTPAWGVFQNILGKGEDFAEIVDPILGKLEPVTDLLNRKIQVRFPKKVKKKKNLGKVACNGDIGYKSIKGHFGDKCWETVCRHFMSWTQIEFFD